MFAICALFKTYLQKSIDWTKSLAARKSALFWLAFTSFCESSIFPLPADILFIPMVAAKRNRAYFYALWATVFSFLGTFLGWLIGRFFFESLALPIIELYGKTDYFLHLQQQSNMSLILILLCSAGFTHLPPIKLVTILAGTLNMPLFPFLLSSFLTRFARFYLLAWLVKNHSERIINLIIKRGKWISLFLCVMLILLYICW